MKSRLLTLFYILILVLLPVAVYSQQSQDQVPKKYALVIGNGAYTGTLSRLANPVNDANDISAVLEHLGFTVEKVLSGSVKPSANKEKEKGKEHEKEKKQDNPNKGKGNNSGNKK